MNHRRAIVGACVLVGSIVLAGCAADNDDAPGGGATQPPAATDEDVCRAFSDVVTITLNADAGLREGRMAEQEQMGWYRLAVVPRELDRIPSNGEGVVDDALEALKSAAPPIKLGAVAPTGIGSDDWGIATADLHSACSAAGFEAGIEAFTGG